MKRESILGFVMFGVLVLWASLFLEPSMSVRFFIGLAFGFALVRASIGFAGSVNKLYRAHSAEVAKTIVYILVLSSLFVAFIICWSVNTSDLKALPNAKKTAP